MDLTFQLFFLDISRLLVLKELKLKLYSQSGSLSLTILFCFCRYIYTGDMDIAKLKDHVMSVLYLARKYMLTELTDTCNRIAKNMLGNSSACR